MKKLILLLVVILSLTMQSCIVSKLSDEPMVVEECFKIRRQYYYKYFYHCKQNNVKIRVYSNDVYTKGQTIKIK